MTEERSSPRATMDALGGVPLLLELGDLPMRRMLIGIKERAERLAQEGRPHVS